MAKPTQQQAPAPAAAAASGWNEQTAAAASGGNEQAAVEKPEAAKKTEALIVVGPRRGRWRAGRKFTPEPTIVPLVDLTEDEHAAIETDPELKVSRG